MAFNFVMLFVGTSVICWTIVYAWWSRVRVTFLRQSLFVIRDRLWDKARELEAFNDPAYRQSREHLNAVISVAGTLSIQSLLQISEAYAKTELPQPLRSENPEMDKAIVASRQTTADEILTYLLFRTATGVAFVYTQIVKSSFASTRQNLERSVAWLTSSSPEELVRSHAFAAASAK